MRRMGGVLLLFSCLTFAYPLNFSTPILANIPVQKGKLSVTLQRYPLTPKERHALALRVRANIPIPFHSNLSHETSKQLGMNEVPVLNQGGYGSCVTFANIAAIDALLAPKDYVSLWCHLTLGQYLEAHSKNYPSGWDGSFADIVLNQIYYYGIIPQSEEKTLRCGHVGGYNEAGYIRAEMSLDEFNQQSQSLSDIDSVAVLNYREGFYFKTKKMGDILNEVKGVLRAGDRMTLGFLIDENDLFLGSSGTLYAPHDTWVMTPGL